MSVSASGNCEVVVASASMLIK